MAVELLLLRSHPEWPNILQFVDKGLGVANIKDTCIHSKRTILCLYFWLTYFWFLCSSKSSVHRICIQATICQLLCMPLQVIKEEGEVKLRVDHLQEINTIFILNCHMVFCTTSLIVATKLKIHNKWQFFQVQLQNLTLNCHCCMDINISLTTMDI